MKCRILNYAFGALALFSAAPVYAHIVIAGDQAAPGEYYAAFFRVSHGCAGSATLALRIEIPEGVSMANPQPKPGWTLDVEKKPLPAPIKTESGSKTDRVAAITWRGRLEADQFDEFGIMMKLPAVLGPLYFPATQTCESGVNDWSGVPAKGQAWRDLARPAPVIVIGAAQKAKPASSTAKKPSEKLPEKLHDHMH